MNNTTTIEEIICMSLNQLGSRDDLKKTLNYILLLMMLLNLLFLCLDLVGRFKKPQMLAVVGDLVQRKHHQQVNDVLFKHGNPTSMSYDTSKIKDELEKLADGNPFAKTCLDCISQKDIEPLVVDNEPSVNMNVLLFLLSKGQHKFLDANIKYASATVSILSANIFSMHAQMKETLPEFFKKK